MLDQKTVDYVKSAQAAGVSNDDIRNTLSSKQIDPAEIDKVLNGSPKIIGNNSLWDIFEHFLMFFSMLIYVVSIGLFWHYCVDKLIPVNSQDIYGSLGTAFSAMMINGYLAGIIVSFPFFTVLFLRVTRNSFLHPELRNLNSRKTLIYLTLAITFIIMTSNIIGFVYNLLNGNIGLNFVAHLALTLFMNGFIFAYYFYQVREDRRFYG